MSVTQADKAKQFRALHEAPGAFVIANVWDGGSARMMAAIGFQGAGHLERRIGGLAGSARRQGHARRGVGPGAGDLRGHRSAGLRRPREGLRRLAGNRCGDDPARGRGRAGRLLDRGRQRQSRRADLRFRPCEERIAAAA